MALSIPRVAVLFVFVFVLLSGCIHGRDFSAPHSRITSHSAYAEYKRLRVDVGIVGRDVETLGLAGSFGVTAVRNHLDFRINAAHAALGIVNLQAKFNILDTRWYGLGGRVALMYLTPRTFWFLREPTREALGDIDLVSAPIELWNSFPFVHWFHFHLGFDYRTSQLWGSLANSSVAVDSNLASRSVGVQPYVNFYIARRIALIAGARVPLYAQAVAEVDGEAEVMPGVAVGTRAVEWAHRSAGQTYRAEFGAETRFGKNTHLRASVVIGQLRPIPELLVMPAVALYWRFY